MAGEIFAADERRRVEKAHAFVSKAHGSPTYTRPFTANRKSPGQRTSGYRLPYP
jgi:hypothetical protein